MVTTTVQAMSKTLLLTFVFSLLYSVMSVTAHASEKNTVTFESFIQKVLTNHESLNLARLTILKTKSELQVIESSLGWNLFASAGLNRNRSFFGAETTQTNLNVGVNKLLESGNSIEVQSNYIKDDSEYAIISSQANPLTTTGIDVNYRIPLLQNKIQNQFRLDRNSVNSLFNESINAKTIIRDAILFQAIELFYGSAVLIARLKTAKQSIERAQKLKLHIQKNIKLGILEKGEILQSNAQIYNLQGQYQELKLVWEQSEIAINRLISQSWDTPFRPSFNKTNQIGFNLKLITNSVKNYNPELKSLNLNLKLVDSLITRNRDNTKSKLDLVFSVGAQNTQGPSGIGEINYSDVIGGVKLEYQKSLDGRGLNSKLYQSLIEKENIKIQILKLEKDLLYDTYSLISNIKRISKINKSYKKRHQIEIEKYNDIVRRYRSGRESTNLVIQFENERTQAELAYKTQEILHEKTISLLQLKQGMLLKNKVEK